MKTLQGKVAIITGAGSGLGKENSNIFAKEGVKVVISDFDEDAGNETVNYLGASLEAF